MSRTRTAVVFGPELNLVPVLGAVRWDQASRPDVPGRRILGVDVVRAGGDPTVLCHRRGLVVAHPETYDREDAMQTTTRVQAALGEEEGAAAVVELHRRGRRRSGPAAGTRGARARYTGTAKSKLRTRNRE
ncbi:hypothetical protein [Streptomyces sp. NPDC093260]|uniref:hypothetical protein n=1 Tax=Streptomyces sp. NPDC093260 TaxID=3155073 RepID=UPI003437BB27